IRVPQKAGAVLAQISHRTGDRMLRSKARPGRDRLLLRVRKTGTHSAQDRAPPINPVGAVSPTQTAGAWYIVPLSQSSRVKSGRLVHRAQTGPRRVTTIR